MTTERPHESATRDVPANELLETKLVGIAGYQHSPRDPGRWRWYLHRRVLEDGRVLTLDPMLHGNLRLGLSPDLEAREFVDQWCYHDHDAAWRAVVGWNGHGDPDGWYRHHATGRRRPDGTPESEALER